MNKITQKQEQEKLWKLVLEVRAKNGMTLSRMNHALERLGKTGMIYPNSIDEKKDLSYKRSARFASTYWSLVLLSALFKRVRIGSGKLARLIRCYASA